jgi:DHA1 family bicyclomycin/chloramphenicol resistance-like MFS transporter
MGPIGFIAFGIALAQPAATTNALAPFPTMAGSAAALLGFMQTGGGLLGSLAAVLVGDPVLALATIIPAMTLFAVAADFGLGAVNRRRQRAENRLVQSRPAAAGGAEGLAPGE